MSPRKSSKKLKDLEKKIGFEDPNVLIFVSGAYVGNFRPWKWERIVVNAKDYTYEVQVSFDSTPLRWWCLERGRLTVARYVKEEEKYAMLDLLTKGELTASEGEE